MTITTQTITLLKGNRPVVAVTAYDTNIARYADEAGVDLILVGDSVGTAQLGYETTIPVTLDMMLHHTSAVMRSKPSALVVTDLPFGLAHSDFTSTLKSCCRLMQEAGAQAIKIEGGATMAPTVERLTEAGVPVLGHIGLLPQQYYKLGGYRKFGRSDDEKSILLNDALTLENAGCFAIVAEMLDGTVAGAISNELRIPIIGIGSGPHCDGQILVCNDLLGMNTGNVPSFVKEYCQLGEQAKRAFKEYTNDVRTKRYPL